MAEYTDYILENGKYGVASEYKDENAIILAIKNILLSRPGNFPFNPTLGMNIRQYQFDVLDESTIDEIRIELNKAIAQYIPNIGNVIIDIRKVEHNEQTYLGISVRSNMNNEEVISNFILKENGDTLDVYNEVN